MALSDVIKSFLVSLSYTVDRPSEKRFKDGLETAGKGVTEFARVASKSMLGFEVASVASFAAIAAGLEYTASKYEGLYYSAQRSGASIKGINEFAYAVSQLGGTAEGARSSLEGVGAFLRSSPGAATVIRNLGVATQINGHARDTADITTDLIEKLHAMPTYQGQRYASMFGIDLTTLNAGVPALRKYEDQLDHYYKRFGFNAKRAGDIAVEFERRQRAVQAVGVVLFETAAVELENLSLKARPFVEKTFGYLVQEAERAGPVIDSALQFMGKGFSSLGVLIGTIWPIFEDTVSPMTKFLRSDLIETWHDVKTGVGGDLAFLYDHVAAVRDIVKGDFVSAWHDAGIQIKHEMSLLEDYLDQFGIKVKILPEGLKAGFAEWATDFGYIQMALNDAAKGHYGTAISDLNKLYHNDTDGQTDASAQLMNGLTGGRYGHVVDTLRSQITSAPTAAQQAAALRVIAGLQGDGLSRGAAIGFAANFMHESSLNTAASNKGHYGIAQWDNSRADAILKGTGIDVRTDRDIGDQIKAVKWELNGPENRTMRALLGVKDASDASTIIDHAYERSVLPGGDYTQEDSWRRSIAMDYSSRYGSANQGDGSKVVNVGAPKTDIHIHGVSDPHQAARAVQQKQTQVQASLVRNLTAVGY